MDYIKIWDYDSSPKELKDLSNNGGDEDWLAIVPDSYDQPTWMYEGTSFGCCCVDEFTHKDYPNCKIFIGSHA